MSAEGLAPESDFLVREPNSPGHRTTALVAP